MRLTKKLQLLIFSVTLFAHGMVYADNYPFQRGIDILHYAFSLTVSDVTDQINGTASVTFKITQRGVSAIQFDLANSNQERLGKGMQVISVKLKGQALSYTHQSDRLQISLPSNVRDSGLVATIEIRYGGTPYTGMQIGNTQFGKRSFSSDNWPNKGRHWLPMVDHPSDKATVEFMVTAPSHYQVISNGLLQEVSVLNDSMKLTHWKQSVPVSPWLFVLGIQEYAVQYVDTFQGKSIETWVHPQNRAAGFYDFAEPTKKVLQFYTDYVGPYAYEKLANIQAPSVSGGMETSSAIFYTEKLVTGTRSERTQQVVIHEIAHQWFGNAVTESTWDDVWLSEGFATYFTLLFVENDAGRQAFVKGLQSAKQTIERYYASGKNFAIVADRSPEKEEVTSAITYQKGAWVLHMLRNTIGDVAFQQGIRTYYKKYFNANATTGNFIAEMEKASGKKLQSFFDQWLLRSGIPQITINWQYDAAAKSLAITLAQDNADNLYTLPLEIEIQLLGAGNLVKQFTLKNQQETFRIPLEKAPAALVADPASRLLATYYLQRAQ
jgi:aminopeptidase N